MLRFGLISCLVVFAASAHGEEPGWGTLRGTVKCDFYEPIGPLAKFDPNEDSLCPKQILDESLIIDQKSHGLKNVLVFARPTPSRIHPRYDEKIEKEVVLAATGCQFSPRICVVWRDRQTFVLLNDDITGYAPVGFFDLNSPELNPLMPAKSRHKYAGFERASSRPFSMSCHIHPWMKAYVLAIDSPYFALTDANGEFEIADLPADEELTLFLWHERYEFFTLAGVQERKPLMLKLKTGEVRQVDDVVLSRPNEE